MIRGLVFAALARLAHRLSAHTVPPRPPVALEPPPAEAPAVEPERPSLIIEAAETVPLRHLYLVLADLLIDEEDDERTAPMVWALHRAAGFTPCDAVLCERRARC